MKIKKVNISWLFTLLLLLLIVQHAYSQSETLIDKAEAESGTFSGGLQIASVTPGYSGTGYVTNFRNGTDKVTVTMNVPSKAYYKLVIRYSVPYGTKTEKVYANISGAFSVLFNSINTFTDAVAGNYLLNAGSNSTKLQSDWGWIDIDKFSIYSVLALQNRYKQNNYLKLSHIEFKINQVKVPIQCDIFSDLPRSC